MDYQQAYTYLSSKPESFEDTPFGPETLVFKVKSKMFALLFVNDDGLAGINLKCDPDQALALRDIFEAVTPGYHMNKKHWNTVLLDGSIPDGELERMVDHSYSLVVKGLTKAKRISLETLYPLEVLYRA